MADLRKFRDSTGQPIQPYYAAFMLAHGFKTADEAVAATKTYEFSQWIERQWAAFEAELGYPIDHHTRISRSEKFTDWLQARSA